MPYKPNQREYRAFSGEFHTSAPASDGQKAYTVEGYATTFDEPYELFRDADGTTIDDGLARRLSLRLGRSSTPATSRFSF